MHKQIGIIFLACFLWQSTVAQRIYSNEFMSNGVGAPALAMGNSVVASVCDVSSGYWNPAGLVSISNNYGLSLMHTEYFAGMAKYDYAGASYRIDDQRIVGLTLLRFGVDDIKNTLEIFDSEGNLDYDRIKKFSVADYGILFSYAQKAKNPNLQYGANVKIIHRIVGEFAKAWGFGFDIGAQFHKNKWSYGIVLRDATSTFNAWSFNNDKLAVTVLDSTFNTISSSAIEATLPKLLLGTGRNFTLNKNFDLHVELDADLTFDGEKHTVVSSNLVSIDPHMGMELGYKKFMFVRCGVGNFQEVMEFDEKAWSFQPTIGFGLQLKSFALDYAFTDVGDQSIAEYSNVFSLRYFWN